MAIMMKKRFLKYTNILYIHNLNANEHSVSRVNVTKCVYVIEHFHEP